MKIEKKSLKNKLMLHCYDVYEMYKCILTLSAFNIYEEYYWGYREVQSHTNVTECILTVYRRNMKKQFTTHNIYIYK